MNAIIVSALLGVVMMFSGIFTTNKTIIKNIATAGVLFLLAANLMEMNNLFSFDINTHDLIVTQRYGLFFNCIAYGATFIYLVLSASDITEVGVNVAEYFALIFFVLCGVAILSSFNGLLMLFIGVEILSIPLYILTGSDKRILKSNNDKIIIPFFCPTCEYPMKQAEDAESYRNHTCCHMCELNWASSNETPDKSSERWKLYMERRHLVFLPQINFK